MPDDSAVYEPAPAEPVRADRRAADLEALLFPGTLQPPRAVAFGLDDDAHGQTRSGPRRAAVPGQHGFDSSDDPQMDHSALDLRSLLQEFGSPSRTAPAGAALLHTHTKCTPAAALLDSTPTDCTALFGSPTKHTALFPPRTANYSPACAGRAARAWPCRPPSADPQHGEDGVRAHGLPDSRPWTGRRRRSSNVTALTATWALARGGRAPAPCPLPHPRTHPSRPVLFQD